jgi:hypothetical protein
LLITDVATKIPCPGVDGWKDHDVYIPTLGGVIVSEGKGFEVERLSDTCTINARWAAFVDLSRTESRE